MVSPPDCVNNIWLTTDVGKSDIRVTSYAISCLSFAIIRAMRLDLNMFTSARPQPYNTSGLSQYYRKRRWTTLYACIRFMYILAAESLAQEASSLIDIAAI